MLFRGKSKHEGSQATDRKKSRESIQHSSAETAHLIGPGCVKLRAQIPIWKPMSGRDISLHPRYLRRVFCYGNVDFSTAVLALLWDQGILVSFLSMDGRRLLAKLQPVAAFPGLARLQHLAAADTLFTLNFAKKIVAGKIKSASVTARYFQQQGKTGDAGSLIRELKGLVSRSKSARQLPSLRGYEGRAAALWYRYYSALLPVKWQFSKRTSHPPEDPANALLSLGYTLATSRCAALLSASDLDPATGFLHDLRAGRPSLACDLVESLRVPLVDRLVLSAINRKQITLDSMGKDRLHGWRLKSDAFKQFIGLFEQEFYEGKRKTSFHHLTCQQIEAWIKKIRDASQKGCLKDEKK